MRPLTPAGDLTLGHVLDAAGLDEDDVVVIRHTYNKDGLVQGQVSSEAVLEYTQEQATSWRVGSGVPVWLCFIADGQKRSRFYGAFTNRGEMLERRTPTLKYFDLVPSDELSSLQGRLVIQWSGDAVNWAKKASVASAFPVIEVADQQRDPFPGFEALSLPYWQLVDVVTLPRYETWRSAMRSVHAIYAIADTTNGKLYVGKADGSDGLLGRWRQYAADGHGGNVALKEIAALAPEHRYNFTFSVLRVYDPSTALKVVNDAESYFKRALLSWAPFGYN